jgi:PPOX class probable F420-dependent enzyme
MPVTIPDSHRYLLDDPVYVVATTVMPDGQPQSTIVWWTSDGDHVLLSTIKGRQKAKNMERDPKITIMAVDPKDPYKWMEVRGVVESMVEEGGRDLIEKLSWKYENKPFYGGYTTRTPESETRLVVRIRPTKIVVYPHT